MMGEALGADERWKETHVNGKDERTAATPWDVGWHGTGEEGGESEGEQFRELKKVQLPSAPERSAEED